MHKFFVSCCSVRDDCISVIMDVSVDQSITRYKRSDGALKDVHLWFYWNGVGSMVLLKWGLWFNSWVLIAGEHAWVFSEPDTCLEVSVACSDCQIDWSHVSSFVLGELVSPSSSLSCQDTHLLRYYLIIS